MPSTRVLSRKRRLLSVALLPVTLGLALHLPLRAQRAEAAEGLPLPTKGGVYAVDKSGADSTLVCLHAVEIKLNAHVGSNLVRGMVYSGPRSTAEIPGINAGIHLHAGGISFLVLLSDEESEGMRDRLAIIRLKQVATGRVISTHSQNIFGGQHKRQDDVIEVTKAKVGDGGWVRISPSKPRKPGEYGIVFLPTDNKLLPGQVYDFDIDFNAAQPEQK